MKIRDAGPADLPAIVDIYNAAIPGRMATADTEPVAAEGRRVWFGEHAPSARPCWVVESEGRVVGWLSFQSFYGRPAYHATAEVSIYVGPEDQRRGIGHALLAEAVRRAPTLGVTTLIGFIFAHNRPSLALFGAFGFQRWALLPRVAEIDGVERDLVIVGLRPGDRSMRELVPIAPQLSVPDVAQAVAFYTERLGFALLRHEPPFAVVALDQAVVLFADESLAGPPPRERGAGIEIRVQVDDVGAIHRRCRERGVAIVREVDDRPHGVRDFTVRDPYGFRLCFASRHPPG